MSRMNDFSQKNKYRKEIEASRIRQDFRCLRGYDAYVTNWHILQTV